MTGKTALVLGATGGIGRSVARCLVTGGWQVRALHRNPEGLVVRDPFEWIRGDALIADDVGRAAVGVDIIVHAAKPRLYRDWHKLVLPMMDNVITAADGARIVMPGNVYNYGPDAGSLIGEEAPQHPQTLKGKLRVEMEQRLEAAVEAKRATALIVRAGDFFGPGAGSSWFSEAMVTPGRRPRTVRNPGKSGIGHQWVYLPDLAETMVQLAGLTDLPPFARFHMDGYWDASGTGMATTIVKAFGQPRVKVRSLPWWAVELAAAFRADFRELLELRYLWEQPIRLRNDHLVRTLGREPHTPLDEAVRSTLKSINAL